MNDEERVREHISIKEVWPNRIIPWTRVCPKCGSGKGVLCVAISDEDALALSGWTMVPPFSGFTIGIAHNERFRPL